jgi:hypothetical protein
MKDFDSPKTAAAWDKRAIAMRHLAAANRNPNGSRNALGGGQTACFVSH